MGIMYPIPEDLKNLYYEATTVDNLLNMPQRSHIAILIERIAKLEAELAQLLDEVATQRAENARMSAPVSEEEVVCEKDKHCRHYYNGGICCSCGDDWTSGNSEAKEQQG